LNPNEVKGYGKRSFPCCRVGGRILGRGKLPLLKSGATRDGFNSLLRHIKVSLKT